jgi:N-acetylmuramoyl-L-alanine amidase
MLAVLTATESWAETAREMYAAAKVQDEQLRAADGGPPASRPALKQYRAVIAAYDAVVRRYPATGYADNALWQGGSLAQTAFDRFGQARDRATATRLFALLIEGYPSSSLAANARAALKRLEAPPTAASRPLRSAADRPATPASETAAQGVLRNIRRTLRPDVVRVTIELDAEIAYRTERVENPPRALFDLPGTRLGGTIVEGTSTYTDDVVRHIRVGRRPDQTTRVVLDLDGVKRYSVSTLSRPYRIVIDCERERPLLTPGATHAPAGLPSGGQWPTSRAVPLAGIVQATPIPRDTVARTPVPHAFPAVREYPPLPSRHTSQGVVTLARIDGIDPRLIRPPLASRPWLNAFAPLAPLVQAATRPTGVDSPTPAASSTTGRPRAVPADAPTAANVDAAPESAQPEKPIAPERRLPERTPAPPPIRDGYSLARQLGLGASKIVIDPGHGGRDPGAEGAGVFEANVVLDVALRLEKLLKSAGIEVVLTRRIDEFVPLEERTAIANREQGDLFLSIHANASRNRNARGIESYVLNFATDPEAEAVAARENAATGRTMSNLPDIVRAITLNSKLDESRSFAALVQHRLMDHLRIDRAPRDLGVKQAPFIVLIGASMPSVLAEISFITNSQEGRLLKTGAYRQSVAEALFDAVRGYQKSLKTAQSLGPHQ